VIAYDYPLLGVFWTIAVVSLWIAWIMLVVHVLVDIFHQDMSGVGKALWCLLVLVVPWLGVLVYLVVHGGSMGRRDYQRSHRDDGLFLPSTRVAAVPSIIAE
jgi:hypothetical protein